MAIAECEERIIGLPWAVPRDPLSQVGFDVLTHLRAEGHEAALTELGLANHKQPTVPVHILMAEPGNLSNPETQTVH